MKTTAESACVIGKREEIKSLPARVAMIVVFMALSLTTMMLSNPVSFCHQSFAVVNASDARFNSRGWVN